MDKTKKYTLIFIIGCFLLIGVGGVYQILTPTSSKDDTNKIVEKKNQQEDIKKEEKDDSKQSSESKDSSSNSEKTDNQKKQTTNSNDKTQTQQKETEKKNESNSSSTEKKEELDEKNYVQLTIRGIDTTIASEKVETKKGDTVYDVLKKLTSSKGMELKTSGPSAIVYIKGINGLNEFENGPKSGWKYKVNSSYPSKSCGAYKIEDGDQIEWIYTIDG